MLNDFVMVFGLYMVIDGVLPFISPKIWKKIIIFAAKQPEYNIRVLGFSSMIIGSTILYLLNNQ
jgi:uncharacterized protein YjeT (DUF2065 family)